MTNTQAHLVIPNILPYLEYLDDVSDEEIKMLRQMLDKEENKKLEDYISVSWEKITNKRIFLYLCNLIDFKEIDNIKNSNLKIK